MPALTRVSLYIAKAYTTCIKRGGVVGATVSKIEHGMLIFALSRFD
jgi:hypothetical protein